MCRHSLRPVSALWAAGSYLFMDKQMRNADEDTQEGDLTLKVSFGPSVPSPALLPPPINPSSSRNYIAAQVLKLLVSQSDALITQHLIK